MKPLRIRWLGRVSYDEAWDLQERLFAGDSDHLLLLEHPPTYTFGVRGREEHLLVDAGTVGADVRRVNRGGDVTFHGPGQLVGYPILDVAGRRGGGMADTVAYVSSIEDIIISSLGELGLVGARRSGYPGVWLDPEGPARRKIAAVGVRLSRGRSMHGFAVNVDTDPEWFEHIVPCGIDDAGVTSLAAEGVDASMADVVELVATHAARLLAPERPVDRADVVWRATPGDLAPFSRGEGPGDTIRPQRPARSPSADDTETTLPVAAAETPVAPPTRRGRRLTEAGVGEGLDLSTRKPEWMRVKLEVGPELRRLKSLSRSLDLVTVCEEAGCPNIYECWNEGTATFMLLGERCTRACGFCLVDTRKPEPPDPGEPGRVAEAVAALDLDHAVLTMVARDDLPDGGAGAVAATVRAIVDRCPGTAVEVLISDLAGDADDLGTILDAAPAVLNHNIETVARLQRAVRPSASYARSLALLARAKSAGAVTKSGMMVGLGETLDEVLSTLADLAAVGVDIVTIGQYLRPTTHHLPIQRWWTPAEFEELAEIGRNLGIAHVESSPLTRSSHHAATAHQAVTPSALPDPGVARHRSA